MLQEQHGVWRIDCSIEKKEIAQRMLGVSSINNARGVYAVKGVRCSCNTSSFETLVLIKTEAGITASDLQKYFEDSGATDIMVEPRTSRGAIKTLQHVKAMSEEDGSVMISFGENPAGCDERVKREIDEDSEDFHPSKTYRTSTGGSGLDMLVIANAKLADVSSKMLVENAELKMELATKERDNKIKSLTKKVKRLENDRAQVSLFLWNLICSPF